MPILTGCAALIALVLRGLGLMLRRRFWKLLPSAVLLLLKDQMKGETIDEKNI